MSVHAPASAPTALPGQQRTDANLAAHIVARATELGFVRVGFCGVEPLARGKAALAHWLAAGYHGELGYMAEHPGRAEPCSLLAEARALVVVAYPYAKTTLPNADPEADRSGTTPHGRVARYAQGGDYHGAMKEKLRALANDIAAHLGRPVLSRACVDTAPLLEREAAERAGVGYIAKSALVLSPGAGTHFLLGELLLDVELPPSPEVAPRCGDCTRCLDACPTRAFIAPYVLDARRCISYLTIELRGPIPRELRPLIGNWVFGCDICQEVCPFNASSTARALAPELKPRADLAGVDLVRLLRLTATDYRRLVRRSALRRTHRPQLQRNAAVAMGNLRAPEHEAVLIEALRTNPSVLVRGHIAWALGRYATANALEALHEARPRETDPWLRDEIEAALARGASAAAPNTARTPMQT